MDLVRHGLLDPLSQMYYGLPQDHPLWQMVHDTLNSQGDYRLTSRGSHWSDPQQAAGALADAIEEHVAANRYGPEEVWKRLRIWPDHQRNFLTGLRNYALGRKPGTGYQRRMVRPKASLDTACRVQSPGGNRTPGRDNVVKYAAGKHGTPGFNPPPEPGVDASKRDSDPLWEYHRGIRGYNGSKPRSPLWQDRPSPNAVIIGGYQVQHHREPDRSVPLPEGFDYWWDSPLTPDRYVHSPDIELSETERGGYPAFSFRQPDNNRRYEAVFGFHQRTPAFSAVFPLQDMQHLAKPNDPYRVLAMAVRSGNRHAIGPLVRLLRQRDNPAGWWNGWTTLHREMTNRIGDLPPEEVLRRVTAVGGETRHASADPPGHQGILQQAIDGFTKGGRDLSGFAVLADHMDENGLPQYAQLIRAELANAMPHLRDQPKGRRRFSRGEPRRYSHQDVDAVLASLTPEDLRGGKNADHTRRKVAADAVEEAGDSQLAHHLRTGTHLMSHQGKLVPARWTGRHVNQAMAELSDHVNDMANTPPGWGGWMDNRLPYDWTPIAPDGSMGLHYTREGGGWDDDEGPYPINVWDLPDHLASEFESEINGGDYGWNTEGDENSATPEEWQEYERLLHALRNAPIEEPLPPKRPA